MVVTMTKDEENLRLLSIFHYVIAGIASLFTLIPFLYVGMGILMLCGKLDAQHPDPAARPIGWFLIAIGTFFVLMGWAFVVCLVMAGRYVSRKRHYMYCQVMAAVACMFMPFGTVLGAFTIIVLQKESVRQLFGHSPASPPVVSP